MLDPYDYLIESEELDEADVFAPRNLDAIVDIFVGYLIGDYAEKQRCISGFNALKDYEATINPEMGSAEYNKLHKKLVSEIKKAIKRA
jgi:hypothetical protein